MFSELVDIQLTFGCLSGSFLGTLGALFLICEGLGIRFEIRRFSGDNLEGPRLRPHTQLRVTVLSVGSSKQVKADKQSAKS